MFLPMMTGGCEPWIRCRPLCKTPSQQTYKMERRYEQVHVGHRGTETDLLLTPSGNIGEVSSAEAAPEQLALVAIKRFDRKIFFLIKNQQTKKLHIASASTNGNIRKGSCRRWEGRMSRGCTC